MTKFDRSKFKSTSVVVAKQADQEVENLVGRGNNGPNADYHKIKLGIQYYRIYPPHPSDGGELYAQPKCVSWLPQEVADRDKQGGILKDKKGDVITKIQDRPMFNAKVHGGKKRDLVEEYYAFSQKVADETCATDKEKKNFLEPIVGGYDSKHNGILPKQSWVMYADELTISKDKVTKVLGRLDIGKAVKNRLNTIAATESASEPLGTDPFTNPDDGRAISITYNNKAEKPQDYYITELYAPLIAGGKGQITLFTLTDEDLEKFEAYPSLKKMFVDVYDRKTFDNVLKGLKMFDDQHELGIFGYEEFLDICEELSSEFPVNGEESDEEESNGDQFDSMDRDELKGFIRDNKLGIIVNKQLDDNAVREKIRELVKNEEELDAEEEEEQTEKEEQKDKKNLTKKAINKEEVEDKKDLPWEENGEKEKESEPEKKPLSSATKDRLAAIKAKNKTK